MQWYDVKTYGMSKKDCEHYYEKDHSKTMKFNMEHALIKLQTVSDAAIVSRHHYFLNKYIKIIEKKSLDEYAMI